MRRVGCLLAALMILGMSGCSQPKATLVPTSPPAMATPVAPAASPVAAFKVLTPVPGKGAVTGTIIRQIRGLPDEPFAETKLYLAKLMTDQSGKLVGLAGLDETTAPACLTNAAGQFVFQEVEPGMYALIVKTPLFPALAHDIVKKQDVVPNVVAGQIVDLGEIRVDIQY